MLARSPLLGFVPTTNFRRAKLFYGRKLGLRFLRRDAFALVFASGGVGLRVVKIARFTPNPYTVLGWQVVDLGRTARALQKRGIRFERYPGMAQDPLGIWQSPEGARVAWFKDPDGNLLSLSQPSYGRPPRAAQFPARSAIFSRRCVTRCLASLLRTAIP